MELLGREFHLASQIDAVRDPDGDLSTYTAYERFANPRALALNRYGQGPFVRLSLDALPRASGVYAVKAEEIVYIGIAVNIMERWGRRGYSVIDPRNCYVGGQATNCHVNSLIATELMAGRSLSLWVHESTEPRAIEEPLLRALRPRWNIQGI